MKGIRIDDGNTNRRRALPLGYALSISFALLQLAASWLLAASTADAPRQVASDAVPDGAVILFRHAIAPGGGDPAGFRLGDCATQRNLDTQGREQARRIGEQLRWKAFRSPRCGPRSGADKENGCAGLSAAKGCRAAGIQLLLRRSIQSGRADGTSAGLASGMAWTGVLAVITHQVNIAALTEVSPSSGEGIVVRPAHDGLFVVGRVPPPAGAGP